MKKTLIVIYSLLIAAVLGLVAYQYFVQKNIETGNIVKIGLVLVGLIISMIRVIAGGNQRIYNKKAQYKAAYSDLIGNAFSDNPKAEKQLYSAIHDFQTGRYGSAVKKFKKLAAQSFRSADRFTVSAFTGLCFDSAKDYHQAIPHYVTALQIRENSTVASNLGLCHSKVGNDEAAIQNYLRAVRADSKNPYPLNNLAQLHIRRGEYTEALDYAQQALGLNDKMVQALNAVTICHAMLGNEAEYEQAFRRAVSCGSNANALKSYINALKAEF